MVKRYTLTTTKHESKQGLFVHYSDVEVLEKENIELKEKLALVANQAHHGGLLEEDSMSEIRKITLPYWNKEECNKLQLEED